MNYLIYIERNAENLQFFLWFRDYAKRFAALPASDRGLAPEWTVEQAEAQAEKGNTITPALVSAETAAVFKGTDFTPSKATVVEVKANPFNTPPRTPAGEKDRSSVVPSETDWSEIGSTLKSSTKSHQQKAAGAFEGADLKWQPCQ